MHPNPAFRKTGADRNIAFARDRGFGALAVNGDGGPLISHIPFLLERNGKGAELHLLRSNPIVTALAVPQPAVIAVQGPDGYISPDWYGVDDQVPTWNYVAVHLHGALERLPQDALHPMLDRLSAHFETRLAPKIPWISGKMSSGVMDRMMRMIVPCRLQVTRIDGTWKLNQNKDDAVRLRAADAVARDGSGSELEMLARLMRDPPAASEEPR
ncbi:MAG: FMN-binding negative transcriptional regulator [Rhodobacter sp.]|nr:FMN-binding negative transcriptional regulator [Rhodobacter sp.]